ncbi:hypothetical protein Pmani_037737 [Petrolisthes manimaculis]|uniref:Uncharacterized protein n=1 Tax=Petrolisthes manimaculis TaxID=1843537 RepID=A0AAE1NH40_9EUCA|nr:hypothetical protein Pmani_037737 [Petrolisthes manimaculis]
MPRLGGGGGQRSEEVVEFGVSENGTTTAASTDVPSTPFLPRNRFLVKLKRQQESKVDNNVIGKSPCVRGMEGQTCRRQLALSSRTCTSGSCMKCRGGCSSLTPSEWPECCRDHLLCCRHLASACLRCDKPDLAPFCSAAFNKCA